MSTAIKGLLVLLAGLLLAGCGQIALLYSDTIAPYSHQFDQTRVGSRRCVITSHRLREPVSGRSLSAEWTTSRILDEAHKAGLTTISYIDRRTLSILLGIYRRESLIIYGD